MTPTQDEDADYYEDITIARCDFYIANLNTLIGRHEQCKNLAVDCKHEFRKIKSELEADANQLL